MDTIRRFGAVLSMAAMGVVALASGASAQEGASAAVGSAVGAASSLGTGVISGNVGVVLAVAGAWVALSIGKKLIGKIS